MILINLTIHYHLLNLSYLFILLIKITFMDLFISFLLMILIFHFDFLILYLLNNKYRIFINYMP